MKFNLSDFLQLDTKELLAVNGGFNCNGSSNTTVYPNTYYSGENSNPNGGGGGAGRNNDITYVTRNRPDGSKVINGYKNGELVSIDHIGKNGEKECETQYPNGYKPKSNADLNNNKSITAGSGGGSCSTSNNPNGQGYSTTSPNPGGNQSKDTKTHSGGGTCTKTGGQSPVNPNPTNPDDVTSGG